MSYGMRAWNAQGVQTFDSYTDLTLFPKTEQFISGNSQVGGGVGISIAYPQFVGKKIMAFLTSPYGSYNPGNTIDGTEEYKMGASVLSCQVSYPGGVPTVRIFVDRNQDTLTGAQMPIHDGYLVVMLTGSNL
jgi:hypothetical protein